MNPYLKTLGPALVATAVLFVVAWRDPGDVKTFAMSVLAWFAALMSKSILPDNFGAPAPVPAEAPKTGGPAT